MTRNGAPVVGFGVAPVAPPIAVAASSPWPMLFVGSVVSAVTGLVVEEIARSARKKRRQR